MVSCPAIPYYCFDLVINRRWSGLTQIFFGGVCGKMVILVHTESTEDTEVWNKELRVKNYELREVYCLSVIWWCCKKPQYLCVLCASV
jgi:hypothetical protein